ncbi:MAG TPA: 6-phosphogluconolactonase, partial [Nitrococcus sp.]|nr:6-phosphogluconolactonase [Nitrococcus sp.]
MNSNIHVVENAQALAHAAAREFASRAAAAVQRKGSFTVALSGGRTPQALYLLLADNAELRQKIPWSQVYFFWGDERPVPPDHPDSNFGM